MIQRARRLAELRAALKRARVTALIGPRQAGKTTQPGDTRGILQGRTLAGIPFIGTDSMVLVKPDEDRDD